jgi:predicted XRE-type DNA-binding protein
VSGLRTVEASVAERHTRRCSGCGCQLSRYNDEDCCGACLRGRPAAAPAPLCVSEHVWDAPEVRLALERDFGRLCTLVRSLGRLRQDDIAKLTGLSQAFLSMLESGARKLTNIDKIVMLLDGLDAPVALTGPMLRNSTEARPLRRAQHATSHLQPA